MSIQKFHKETSTEPIAAQLKYEMLVKNASIVRQWRVSAGHQAKKEKLSTKCYIRASPMMVGDRTEKSRQLRPPAEKQEMLVKIASCQASLVSVGVGDCRTR